MAGMSPAALARCKTMVIESVSDDDNEYRMRLQVFDPRGGITRKVDEFFTRTPQDTARARASFMRKHRVPSQNVTEPGDGS